jgi:hypothetical protein
VLGRVPRAASIRNADGTKRRSTVPGDISAVHSRSADSPAPWYAFPTTLALGLLLIGSIAAFAPAASSTGSSQLWETASTSPVGIASFTVQPSPVSVGSTAYVNVSLSGGTAPYYLWFNGSVPGCQSPNSPVTANGPQFQFTCNPSSTGTYSIHLDVVDSSTPVGRASNGASVNVVSGGNNNNNNNNNNGNGNGSGSGGSFSFPSGLQQLVFLIGLVFLATMVAIAAGTIATAAIVSRRLRQINETLAKMGLPPKDPKPPA